MLGRLVNNDYERNLIEAAWPDVGIIPTFTWKDWGKA
jgi:hypothetical protein